MGRRAALAFDTGVSILVNRTSAHDDHISVRQLRGYVKDTDRGFAIRRGDATASLHVDDDRLYRFSDVGDFDDEPIDQVPLSFVFRKCSANLYFGRVGAGGDGDGYEREWLSLQEWQDEASMYGSVDLFLRARSADQYLVGTIGTLNHPVLTLNSNCYVSEQDARAASMCVSPAAVTGDDLVQMQQTLTQCAAWARAGGFLIEWDALSAETLHCELVARYEN
ncbi:hypothetical protein JKP88DRAFT_247474 [Tribonema minus]|uniref:Uncharacterized protein n=1 Tax=Tribonema minus TaxID=303371 RepID=A0A835YY36_9STRA|nr:hypothetical protein JKP88DRAFT_247474 [Tribonema minus]